MRRLLAALVVLALLAPAAIAQPAEPTVTVASKAFPESWILGDALAALARESGANVVNKSNLGQTEIIYQAILQGSVDVYPEYTGTIAKVLLKESGRPTHAEMLAGLARQGLGMSYPLGFNDSYGLAVTKATASKYGLERISDLALHPELKAGLSHEFAGRDDGWPGLKKAYGLQNPYLEIQHDLAYTAIKEDRIQLIDVYTTDAQIERQGLHVLKDDKSYFPPYDAVLLYRADLPARAPQAFAAMMRLVGRIDETRMIQANAMVVLDGKTPEQAAEALLRASLGTSAPPPGPTGDQREDWLHRLGANTVRHLQLVGLSLAAAIAIGVPLGVLASRSRFLASVTLSGSGVIQTIPSLALLAVLIPFLGVGMEPAIVALFLYSLLPIVRNTFTGLTTIPPNLTESAVALGLPGRAQLTRVFLPLASPSIMAGIKTSAVINVGTATLAALIGAGGLGEPILRGITLLDNRMIFEGAVPAAVLALLVQGGFDLLERFAVPRGLRLKREPGS